MVDREVAQEPDAVRVFAANLAVAERQRVDGASRGSALGEMVTQPDNFRLVRDRDVEPFATGALELAYGRLELLGRNLEQLVLDVFAGLKRE